MQRAAKAGWFGAAARQLCEWQGRMHAVACFNVCSYAKFGRQRAAGSCKGLACMQCCTEALPALWQLSLLLCSASMHATHQALVQRKVQTQKISVSAWNRLRHCSDCNPALETSVQAFASCSYCQLLQSALTCKRFHRVSKLNGTRWLQLLPWMPLTAPQGKEAECFRAIELSSAVKSKQYKTKMRPVSHILAHALAC